MHCLINSMREFLKARLLSLNKYFSFKQLFHVGEWRKKLLPKFVCVLERWRGFVSLFLWLLLRFYYDKECHSRNEEEPFFLMLVDCVRFNCTCVTRDRQRDICSWHLYFNCALTLQQKSLSLIYGWYLALLGLCFQMKTFNVSPTRMLSQPHFDWQIKFYLFTPEFNFMSDKSNHKHSFFPPRRLDE